MLNFSLVQSVKVLAGSRSSLKTGEVLSEAGYKKAFLVFDSGVKACGILEGILASLKENSIDFVEFDQVVPDPPAEIVNLGASICKDSECDCVVAIGGGSALDTAKGINILRFNEGNILEYATKSMNHCSGLITIPTTSGTGSELSNGAIISDVENDAKVPILCYNCMSEYTIIDPELTLGMPEGLTMMTGLDVFSHAAEAYTSALSNIMTDPICEKIMQEVVTYLPIVLKDKSNIVARTKMQASASLGGWMLYNACAHVGHSIAHVIGANYHLVHGAACAYGLPVVLKQISAAVPEKVKTIGEILGAQFTGTETYEEIGKIAAEAYITFRDKTIGLKPISSYNLDLSLLDKIEDEIVKEPFAALSPVPITKEKVKEMLSEIVTVI